MTSMRVELYKATVYLRRHQFSNKGQGYPQPRPAQLYGPQTQFNLYAALYLYLSPRYGIAYATHISKTLISIVYNTYSFFTFTTQSPT